MEPTSLVGAEVVLCDQGDGWFSGLPKAISGRVDGISLSSEGERTEIWQVLVSLNACDYEPRSEWDGAGVAVMLDRERLGVVDGTVPFAPSVPAYLEQLRETGRAAPAISAGKVTVFPALHFAHLIESVGCSPASSDGNVGLADTVEFELLGDPQWRPADGRSRMRAACVDRAPVQVPGMGVSFGAYRFETPVAWPLNGMPSASGAQVSRTTTLALLRTDARPIDVQGVRGTPSVLTVVPVVEMRDLAMLTLAATFPVASAEFAAG